MNLPDLYARSSDRETAKKNLRQLLESQASGLKSGSSTESFVEGRDYPEIALFQDSEGFVARPITSKPAKYKNGGMHAKKNKPMYGKGGMAKLAQYMSGGRIYAENGDRVPPSRTQLAKSFMGEKGFIDRYGYPEDKAAFYEDLARKDADSRYKFDGSSFNGPTESSADPEVARNLINQARNIEQKLKRTGVSEPLSGAYRDAGEGETAELERFLDAYGIFGEQSNGGLGGELSQIASGIKSYLSGDGYKRGYNDEYFNQQKESNQERYRAGERAGYSPFKQGGKVVAYGKGGFPDLTGDGKVTMADILKGRGVGK